MNILTSTVQFESSYIQVNFQTTLGAFLSPVFDIKNLIDLFYIQTINYEVFN